MEDVAIWLIRIGAGVTMLGFGVDQLLHPSAWTEYVPNWMHRLLPMSKEATLRVHSFGNLGLGTLLVLGVLPVVVAWATLVWWLSILPFSFWHRWTIGMRDLSVTFALAAYLWLLIY